MIMEHHARLQDEKHKEISLPLHRRNVFGYYCMVLAPRRRYEGREALP